MNQESVKLKIAPRAEGQEYHPDKAEIADRVGEVLDLIASGDRPEVICQKLSGKWKASERTVRRYLTRAYSALAEAGKVKAKEELGRTLIRFDYLYRKAIETADYRLGLAVTRERGELVGLYEKGAPREGSQTYSERIAALYARLDGAVPDYSAMTPAEKIKLAREKAAKLNKLADAMEAEGDTGEPSPALGQPGAAKLAS